MDTLQIPFGTQELALRNKNTLKYLGFKVQTQTLAADFPPSSIKLHTLDKKDVTDHALRLKILSRDPQKSVLVQQGCKVFLVNAASDEYLTCTSKGQLKFDKKSMNQEMNKMLFKSATWTLQYLHTQRTLISPSRNNITIYDQICLKSVYGGYLTVKNNNDCETIGQLNEERSVWNLMKAESLYIPNWIFQRSPFSKFMNLEGQQAFSSKERKNLRAHPPELQETLLVQDLLDVMMGYEGVYIKRRPNSYMFVIQPHLQTPSCNIALTQLTYRVLELPSHYYKIENYISVYNIQQGIICQALCGGLRVLLKEYKSMIMQIDELAKEGLSLQMIWYYIQNSMKVMRSLSDLIKQAQNLKGGQLISCLIKLINENTDETIVNIYNFLFNKISTLYVQMLCKWLYQGVVEDKNKEFMIMMDQNHQSTEWNYWEEKYILRNNQIPSLLERDAHTILVTGKYLNILKACNKQIDHPFAKQIEKNIDYHIKRQNFTDPINKAYEWANKQLQTLVFTECKLVDVLKSMKGYYFLEYGDLFVHFMDAAEEDLSMQKKNRTIDAKSKHFSVQKLQNLFQLLIRTSSANGDLYKDDVSCKIDNSTLYEQVHRIKTLESQVFNFDFSEKPYIKKDSRYVDFLTLDFKSVFPLNLIINKKNISKYQVLFRYMFWCKFIERQLNCTWLTLQATKQIPLDCYRPAYILNHRMIHFIKNLIYYLCEEVIEQNWLQFMENLKKVQNFEDIIKYHDDFLNTCMKESLLTNNKLLPIFTVEIGNTCQGYFMIKSYLSKIQDEKNTIYQTNLHDNSLNQRKQRLNYIKSIISDLMEEKNFVQFITGYGKTFNDSVKRLLKEIGLIMGKQQNYLVRLVEMLDEENYYHKKFGHIGYNS